LREHGSFTGQIVSLSYYLEIEGLFR